MTGAALDTGSFRTDIQGLRAVAVLLVLVFHLWPDAAPGGYVGVDVFFVISGYLMTGLLVREAEAAYRISLARFYARRIRRLLPAASVTLVVVGLASIFLLPLLRWQDTAAEITASAFYVENWWLRSESVDYLALEQAPSPVQHFWSLSVEEQFYIVWPLMMVSLLWLRRRTGWPLRRLLAGGLLALTAASLVHSVRATIDAPGPAYFSSATRLWELGFGGLLVLAPAVRGSRFLVWGGLAAIGAAGALYSTETSFPGYAALLPTGGTAAVILAARSGGVLALRPLQYLGGISYSLYLWHWPLIVFHGVYQGDEIGPWAAVAIGALSIALAHASKVLVEDPVRTAGGLQRRLWRSYAVGGALALACAATAAGLHLHIERIGGQSAAIAADYPGARALSGVEVAPHPIRPTPLEASRERGAAHGDASRPSCIQDSLGLDVITCEYGRRTAARTIALIGDSHAEHWLPAFEELARLRDWRVVTYLKDSCLMGDVTVHFRPLGRNYTECDA